MNTQLNSAAGPTPDEGEGENPHQDWGNLIGKVFSFWAQRGEEGGREGGERGREGGRGRGGRMEREGGKDSQVPKYNVHVHVCMCMVIKHSPDLLKFISLSIPPEKSCSFVSLNATVVI